MTDYDMIVVGSGFAGLCAAVEGIEAGARVLLVDGDGTAGGSSRLSTGIIMGAGTRFQRAKGVEDTPDELYRHYMTLNQWRVQPSIAHRFAYEAGETIEWLEDRGVEIRDVQVLVTGEDRVPRNHTTGGGEAIVAPLLALLNNSHDVDVALGQRVDRLVVNDGRVCGVASGDDEVTAAATILATGGMSANLGMLAQWYPRSLVDAGGTVRYAGFQTAQGDSIRLAMALGAQVVGENRGSRVPMSPIGGLYLPTFALVVNQLGRRYFDETTFGGASERLLAAQPGAVAYVIIDDAVKNEFVTPAQVRPHVKAVLDGTESSLTNCTSEGLDMLVQSGSMQLFQSVAELATKLGIPLANLEGTLERYNGLVDGGSDDDYLKASAGLRRVATPPFYVGAMRLPMLGLTGAGLRIDHEARVIHETSRPIPGLFAAGEAAGGVIGDVYAGAGNAISAATVFGRVAGRTAAQEALVARQ